MENYTDILRQLDADEQEEMRKYDMRTSMKTDTSVKTIPIHNEIIIQGWFTFAPEYSHTNNGEEFYTGILEVPRESGTHDKIPVTISQFAINEKLQTYQTYRFKGEIRTRNIHNPNTDRMELELTVFVTEQLPVVMGVDNNKVELEGYVCKAPIGRKTPYGKNVCDILLAVNRKYKKSDYVPCVTWGRCAIRSEHFDVGDCLHVYGRLQSRDYIKRHPDGSKTTHTTYELSISRFDLKGNNRHDK